MGDQLRKGSSARMRIVGTWYDSSFLAFLVLFCSFLSYASFWFSSCFRFKKKGSFRSMIRVVRVHRRGIEGEKSISFFFGILTSNWSLLDYADMWNQQCIANGVSGGGRCSWNPKPILLVSRALTFLSVLIYVWESMCVNYSRRKLIWLRIVHVSAGFRTIDSPGSWSFGHTRDERSWVGEIRFEGRQYSAKGGGVLVVRKEARNQISRHCTVRELLEKSNYVPS